MGKAPQPHTPSLDSMVSVNESRNYFNNLPCLLLLFKENNDVWMLIFGRSKKALAEELLLFGKSPQKSLSNLLGDLFAHGLFQKFRQVHLQ
jgi:hypothetical protein